MVVNVYITIDPKGDRPYVSTQPPPKELDRSKGVKVYLVEAFIPDEPRVDGVQQARAARV